MANLMPEVSLEMRVGATGKRLSHQFAKATRLEAQPLTGYAGWATFAYVGEDPHVVRACLIDEVNGLAIYELQGDELTKVGDLEMYFTVQLPDYYIGTAPGTFFLENSSQVLRIRVLGVPT
jgi:hypothetical protein